MQVSYRAADGLDLDYNGCRERDKGSDPAPSRAAGTSWAFGRCRHRCGGMRAQSP